MAKNDTEKDQTSSTNGAKRKTKNDEKAQNGDSKRARSSDPSLNYEPKLFLRCHCLENDPNDNNTQVWRVSFRPRTGDYGDSQYVATCGGNTVCLIDCFILKVSMRFIDADKSENFFALSWTKISQKGTDDAILAVGGLRRTIVLLGPNNLSCYEKIRDAHDREINCLLFHSSIPTYLFSGGYDKKIKLWDIEVPMNRRKSQLLTQIDMNLLIINMSFSSKFNCLLVSGEDGLSIWCDVSTDTDNAIVAKFKLPKSRSLVDGLVIMPNDPKRFVMRQTKSDTLSIVDLEKAIHEIKSNNAREVVLEKEWELEYAKFEQKIDYIYMTAQRDLIVSGDDDGQLWIYQMSDYRSKPKDFPICADRVIQWPVLIQNKIVDETKPVLVNSVTVSPDLNYIIAATNINLVCIWKLKQQ